MHLTSGRSSRNGTRSRFGKLPSRPNRVTELLRVKRRASEWEPELCRGHGKKTVDSVGDGDSARFWVCHAVGVFKRVFGIGWRSRRHRSCMGRLVGLLASNEVSITTSDVTNKKMATIECNSSFILVRIETLFSFCFLRLDEGVNFIPKNSKDWMERLFFSPNYIFTSNIRAKIWKNVSINLLGLGNVFFSFSSASPSLGSTGAEGGGGVCGLTGSSIGSFIFNPYGTQNGSHHHPTSTTTRENCQPPDISLDVSRSDEIRVRDYIAYLKATR